MNMLRKLSLIILFFTFVLVSFAQNNMLDVVFLKDGSVYRGMILENKINEYVKIEIVGKNIIVIKYDAIDKIEKEVNASFEDLDLYKDKGLATMFEMGLILGDYDVQPSFTLEMDWHFKRKFNVGGGVGFEYIDVDNLPVYACFKYDFLEKRSTPYVSFKTGYAVPFEYSDYYDSKGGWFTDLGVGIKAKTGKNTSVLFSFAYRLQEMYAEEPDWNSGSYEVRNVYNRIVLKFGFFFF